MSSGSQLSPAGLRGVAVIVAVASGICVLGGAVFNVVSVATAYWVVLGSDTFTINFGLWSVCAGGKCYDIDNPPTTGNDDQTASLYASRVLAVTAMALCLISAPMAVAGFIARKKVLVFSAAAIVFFQSVSFALGLVIFVGHSLVRLYTADESIKATPGWSFYVGGLGAFLYFVGGIILCISQAMHMRRRVRDGQMATTGVYNGGTSYKPLQEAPPAYDN